MKIRHTILNLSLAIALVFGLLSIALPALAVSLHIVISQVYGGGGSIVIHK